VIAVEQGVAACQSRVTMRYERGTLSMESSKEHTVIKKRRKRVSHLYSSKALNQMTESREAQKSAIRILRRVRTI